jgi:hypothetical protein
MRSLENLYRQTKSKSFTSTISYWPNVTIISTAKGFGLLSHLQYTITKFLDKLDLICYITILRTTNGARVGGPAKNSCSGLSVHMLHLSWNGDSNYWWGLSKKLRPYIHESRLLLLGNLHLTSYTEGESKEKHGVWDPMPELTITS